MRSDLSLQRLRDDGAGEAVHRRVRPPLRAAPGSGGGLLPGDALEPVDDVPALEELDGAGDPTAILDRLAVIKLNGGLGTSMGLHGPKSLIEVKPGHTFLDVIARQVLALRARHDARLPLVLLDSFSTRARTLEALPAALAVPGIPPDFLQSREPKLRADTLAPVDWPADPELEWCPPGHGDLYVSLHASGMLADAAGRRDRLGLREQQRQLGRRGRRADPGLGRRPRRPVRDGGRARDGRRPQGRPHRPAPGRRPRRPARDGPGAARRRARSPTSTAGASTTPTTSGSTSAPCDGSSTRTRPDPRSR